MWEKQYEKMCFTLNFHHKAVSGDSVGLNGSILSDKQTLNFYQSDECPEELLGLQCHTDVIFTNNNFECVVTVQCCTVWYSAVQ